MPPMLAYSSLGLNDVKKVAPARSNPGQNDPEQPICVCQPWPRMAMLEDGELLPQDEVLKGQLPLGTQR